MRSRQFSITNIYVQGAVLSGICLAETEQMLVAVEQQPLWAQINSHFTWFTSHGPLNTSMHVLLFTLRLGLFLIFLPADLKASVCFKMQSQNRSLGRLMWKQNCNFEIWKRQSWTFGGNLLAVLWHFQHRLTLRSDKCLGRNVTLKNVTVELHCVTLWSVCVCVCAS